MNYIKRKSELYLSKTYLNKKAGFVIGGILLLPVMGLIGMILYLTPEELAAEGPVFIPYVAAGVFGFASFTFLIHSFVNTAKPRKPLVYSPASKALSMISMTLVAVIFIGAFLSLFHFASFEKGKDTEYVFYMICFFALMFGIMFLIQLVKAVKYLRQDMRFGKSTLVLKGKNSFQLGEEVQAIFKNDTLFRKTDRAEVYLRNIHEVWDLNKAEDTKIRSNQGQIMDLISEAKETISLTGNKTSISLQLPQRGDPTNYLNYMPTYWEVEISNSEVGYYSRFFLEVG